MGLRKRMRDQYAAEEGRKAGRRTVPLAKLPPPAPAGRRGGGLGGGRGGGGGALPSARLRLAKKLGIR